MKKKLLSVVLTAVMAASVLTGCGSTDNGTASTAAATGTAQSEAAATSAASTDGKVYNIGTCQLVEHELWMQQPRDSGCFKMKSLVIM